ncbi:MAG: hypothetical protein R2851_27775 [Caldilineaceae bacterium]
MRRAGCSTAGESAPADTGDAAAAPAASDGEKTIIWGVYQEPEILNPAIRTQTVANDVAKLTEEGLVGVDPDGNYYALLATEVPSPENGLVSDDGLVITYPLRDDVLWSDGEPSPATTSSSPGKPS